MSLWDSIKDEAGEIWGGASDAVTDAVNGVSHLVDSLANGVSKIAGSAERVGEARSKMRNARATNNTAVSDGRADAEPMSRKKLLLIAGGGLLTLVAVFTLLRSKK